MLEVGCGEGFVLGELAAVLPATRPQGLDGDRAALEIARIRLEATDLLLADAAALPFAAGTQDLVLCLEVLEHLDRPQAALVELARVAKGPLIASVPRQPHFSLANFARGKNWRYRGDDPEHRQRWRAGQFLALLGEAIEVRRVVYPFPWVVVLGWKKR